jgi:hypothetical protein
MPWLEIGPIWLIGLSILVALIVAGQLGYGARRVMVRSGVQAAPTEGFGYVLSGALALLGLLIAFTFGAASERFDTRRLLVVEEANAIGKAYLRMQALDEAPKAALNRLMVQYGHIRREWYQAGEDPTRLAQAKAGADDLQNKIWNITIAEVRAHPTATINPSLLQAVNDMFDLEASRNAALEARVPISILRALVLYAFISAALIGYGLAEGPRQIVISSALYFVLSLAICLILDIDRPRGGAVRVSQAPMDREIASIESAEAAKGAALQKPAL